MSATAFFSGSRQSEHRFTDDDLNSIRGTISALEKLIRRAEGEQANQTAWEFQQAKALLAGILSKGKVLLTSGVEDEQRYCTDD